MADAGGAPDARRAALVIASYEFDDPKFRELRAPAHDAEQLAQVLAEPSIGDFEVRTLVNAPVEAVRQELEAFFADRRPDDLLLVYFSGHGVKDPRGRLYFAMKNTSFQALRATGLEARYLSDQMEDSRSKRIVVLLDCCYSGAFLKGFRARGGDDVDVKDELEGRGRAVITASRSTEYAWEADSLVGSAAPSVFTSALVRGLQTGDADRNGDGRVTIDELYDFVFDRVRETVGAQTPGKWSDVEGELVIARNPAPPVRAVELPPELQRAVESDAALQRVGAVLELTNWLHSDDEIRVARAREVLEGLADDPDRRVSDAARSSLGSAERVVPEPVPERLPDPEPSPTRERRPRRARPALLALAAVVLVGTAVAVFLATRDDGSSKSSGGATPTTPAPTTTPTTSTGFSGRPDRVMHFAGPSGCANLDRCLGRTSQQLYGFQFQKVYENADPTVTRAGLESGDIDVGAVDARVADISFTNLVRLKDDKGLQPSSGLDLLGFYVTPKTASRYGLVNMSDLTTKR